LRTTDALGSDQRQARFDGKPYVVDGSGSRLKIRTREGERIVRYL
jgi:hypothetical protein